MVLGRELAPLLAPGMVVWLNGDLGSGKTALLEATARALAAANSETTAAV